MGQSVNLIYFKHDPQLYLKLQSKVNVQKKLPENALKFQTDNTIMFHTFLIFGLHFFYYIQCM